MAKSRDRVAEARRSKGRARTKKANACRKFRHHLPAGARLREARPLHGTFVPVAGEPTTNGSNLSRKALAGLATRCACGALVFAEFFIAGACPACALKRSLAND